jgi:hypothetical protein
MNTTKLTDMLRRAAVLHASEPLPSEVRYRDRYGNVVAKPLLDATLDEIVFASQCINEEISALIRRQSTLDDLHKFARRQGYLGAERVGAIAEEVSK